MTTAMSNNETEQTGSSKPKPNQTATKPLDMFKLNETGGGFVFGLALHCLTWYCVSWLLFAINLFTTFLFPPWFLFPTIGWAILLVFHTVATIVIVNQKGGNMGVFVNAYVHLFDKIMNIGQATVANAANVDTEQTQNRDVLLLKENGSYLFLALGCHGMVWLLTSLLLFFINLVTTLLFPPWFAIVFLIWGSVIVCHTVVTFLVITSRGGDFTAFANHYIDKFTPTLGLNKFFADSKKAM